MDLLVKQKIYVWVIIALILLNLSVLLLIWLDSPKPPVLNQRVNRFPVGDFFSKELNLSEEQKKSFDDLRTSHFKEIDSLLRQVDSKRSRLSAEIFNPNSDRKIIEQIADSIGNITARTAILRVEHFSKLYSLLDKKQAEKFKKMISETERRGPNRMMPFKSGEGNPGMGPQGPGPASQGQRPDGNPRMREGEMPPPPNGDRPQP